MTFRTLTALCLTFLTLLTVQASAQAPRTCGTMDKLALLLSNDPLLAADLTYVENHTQNVLNSPAPEVGTIYRIPVVVHIVYRTTAQNVSNAQVQTQIDVLNEDFRKMNADSATTQAMFQGVAADAEIEFCPADVDPNGNPTTGITRRLTTTTSFTTNDLVMATSTGGQDAWPTTDYLNIWVCNLSGFLGYAQFPGGPASTDGIVIDYAYFGRGGSAQAPFDLGRTATHEVGHWLNLRHIWGDGGCGVDDLVADTPTSDAPNYGCALGHASCGSVDMVQNYMDYSDDPCMTLFTAGQASRMRALFASGGFRESLLSSTGCSGVLGAPNANFSASATSGDVPFSVSFTAQTTGIINTHQWTFGDGGMSTLPNPAHTYTTAGSYTVALTVTGPNGTDTETKTNFITASPPGTFPDGSFENQTATSAPGAPWTVLGSGHVINPVGPATDNGLPSHGTQWCEVSATGTNDATPPSNPGGVTVPSAGAAGIAQSFNYDPSLSTLQLTASFVRNENANQTIYNDFMTIDVSDGVTTQNIFYRDTFSAAPLTSSKYGDAMTTPESVSVDLAILFPTATPATVFDLTILVGNGGDGLVSSRGYVDRIDRVPGSGTQPPQGTGYLYLTFEQNTQVPGLGTVQPADIVRYDYVAASWEMFFDASDLGLGNSNIDAMQVFPGGIIVFSLTGPNLQIPTLVGGPSGTLVSPSDLIAFVPTQTGPNTAGALYFLFDGSDASLTTADEDIDGLYMLEDGTMLMSTSGPASLPGVGNIEAADLIVYFPFSLGAFTTGYAVFAFDGSDVGLTTSDENIDALHFNSEFKTTFSTTGDLSAGGAMGANEDIFVYTGAYGTGTSGTIMLNLDLSQVGIPSSANVNGMTRVK